MPENPYYTCPKCSVLRPVDDKTEHEQWHLNSTRLIRIAEYGQTNPALIMTVWDIIVEAEHLTPEERAEYTFILENREGMYLISEKDAREVSPLVQHLSIGNDYYYPRFVACTYL